MAYPSKLPRRGWCTSSLSILFGIKLPVCHFMLTFAHSDDSSHSFRHFRAANVRTDDMCRYLFQTLRCRHKQYRATLSSSRMREGQSIHWCDAALEAGRDSNFGLHFYADNCELSTVAIPMTSYIISLSYQRKSNIDCDQEYVQGTIPCCHACCVWWALWARYCCSNNDFSYIPFLFKTLHCIIDSELPT